MPYEIGEVELIITPDGEKYYLNDGLMRGISEIGGRGMPGVEYDAFQGYMQPYPVVTAWRLEPRTVDLILTMSATSREEYWQNRYDLIQALRFNRGGRFTLRHTRSDGTQRDLLCFVDSSPIFPDDLNVWAGEEVEINLIAHDPLFKDAYDTVSTTTFSLIDDLIFPITFPIEFKPEGYSGNINITYTGSFVAYPQIEIVGPYTEISLTHLQTGAYLGLTVPITASESRTIDLTPREQSIVDASGDDKFGELDMPESNLITFNLRPEGTNWRNSPFEGIADGLNQIWIQGSGITSDTQITFTYKRQYLDIA